MGGTRSRRPSFQEHAHAHALWNLTRNAFCSPFSPLEQASNLFERTVAALSRLSQATEVDAALAQPARIEAYGRLAAAHDSALRCLQSVLTALDAWAAPIKESTQHAAGAGEEARTVRLLPPARPPPA